MIGGNVYAVIQCKTTETDEIGAQVEAWADVQTVRGWLDLSATDNSTNYSKYNAKIQAHTHVVVSDSVRDSHSITDENSRAVINGKRYDITLIDDPMGMHKQLEIYLKYTGGQ